MWNSPAAPRHGLFPGVRSGDPLFEVALSRLQFVPEICLAMVGKNKLSYAHFLFHNLNWFILFFIFTITYIPMFRYSSRALQTGYPMT